MACEGGYYDDEYSVYQEFEHYSEDRMEMEYFCAMCDSHMNSVQMLESHLAGKKHAKNKRKQDDEALCNLNTLKRNDLEPLIQKTIYRIREPLIGLHFMCELQKKDAEPVYTCFLCHGTICRPQFVEHVLSTKHRLSVLRVDDPRAYAQVENMQLDDEKTKDLVVADKASELEIRCGRGRIQVKVEKSRHDQDFRRVNDQDLRRVIDKKKRYCEQRVEVSSGRRYGGYSSDEDKQPPPCDCRGSSSRADPYRPTSRSHDFRR